MLEFPIADPHSPYDILALIETYRDHLGKLEFADLAILYGLSRLETFQDEAFCRKVESYLADHPDPVRAQYEFAYALASSFWEFYAM